MKKTMFNELLKSVKEMDLILKGKKKPSRQFTVDKRMTKPNDTALNLSYDDAMLARTLNQKPHIGANFSSSPKSARERAAERWFLKKKPPLSTTTASDKTLPGQYYDSETELHYNHHRYYDPTLGRYITSDPIGLSGGANTYSYAAQNAITGMDPSGLFCNTVNGNVYCSVPGGSNISFPEPGDWPGSIGSDSTNYHEYNIPVDIGGADPACVLEGITNDPTPGNDSPATEGGAPNNATPPPFGGIIPSPVQSYTRNGGSVVVNVTVPGHPLHPGYVARSIDGGNVNNRGEGTGYAQGGAIPQGIGIASRINNVWDDQTQAIIDKCKCK